MKSLTTTALFLVLSLIFIGNLHSQQIFFKFTNGETKAYQINEVRKITFSGTLLNLHLWSGSTESWELSTLENYSFDNTTGLLQPITANSDLQLFPNPASGKLTIRYRLNHPGEMQLEIYDFEGKLVKDLSGQRATSGPNELIWNTHTQNGKPAPAGTYICRLTVDGQIFTRRFVLQ